MNAVQLNTRVSKDLRKKGGESFSNAGYSLSEAIRIYLDFAARNINKPQEILETLESMKANKSKNEINQQIKMIDNGANLLNAFCEKHKLKWEPDKKTDNMSYKELRDYFFDLYNK